ncbi:MAG TPA: hypothetical protein VKQ11_00430 [Candidatus Sulfotelmatobacter sp.]|nr:hypothetical protein [Candidatus Sulfotelmatobacter sp.]
MPAYSRKYSKFFCKGMNLNRSLDAIGDGEFGWLYNVRQYRAGELVSRPGLALTSNSFGATGPTDYLHSGYTLNDTNPDSSGGTRRFVGYNTTLWWGDQLISGSTFTQIDSGFSGNPLSMVAFSPKENPTPFLYVGDSNQSRKYSSSYLSAGIPTVYTIGIPQSFVDNAGPVLNCVSPIPTFSAGSITGTGYQWRWVLRHLVTGSTSAPGAPTYTPQSLTNQQASFPDPNTALSTEYIWDLYRFGGTLQAWAFVGSVVNSSGGTVTDNFTDLQLDSAQTLDVQPGDVLFQPFLVRDVPRSGTAGSVNAAQATVPGALGGHGSQVNSAAQFNPNWIHGTTITVNDIECTISAIVSSSILFVDQDLGNLGAVGWKVDGALEAGAPLPYMWGPYGAGQFGLYMFGCGDPRNPGTLYWTNGNDPDTTSPTNSLELCSPSEILQNGCIWNGRCYVWSNERMWEVTPDLINAGQFIAQVIPGARGLAAPWAFCVGDLIYFVAKDGIYESGGGLPKNISDAQMYQLFGHDSLNGEIVAIPDPEGAPGAQLLLYTPDPNNQKTWRLTWYDGVLYFDYVEFTTGLSRTLVRDSHIMNGWIIDYYPASLNVGYVYRFGEEASHDVLVGVGSSLGHFFGNSDFGQPIECAVMTGADLLGDYRAPKLIGDAVVGGLTNNTNVTARLLGSLNTIQLGSGTLNTPAYGQLIIDVGNGLGQLDRTAGLWFHWSSTVEITVSDWEPSYVLKPETIQKRATDWTDDGLAGSKFLKAVVIEANVSALPLIQDLVVDNVNPLKVSSGLHTFVAGDVGSILQVVGGAGFTQGTYSIQSIVGSSAILDHSPGALNAAGGFYILSGNRTVQVQYDGGSVAATITLAAPGQTELPYSIVPPVVCREMRLVPTDAKTCEIFNVRYVWDQYPEYLDINEDFYLDKWPTNKYIRGVAIEGDTQGSTVQAQVQADGGTVISTLPLVQSGKTLSLFAFGTPFLSSEVRLIPLGHWRKHSIRWIFDEYPDFAGLITPWDDGGHRGAKYLRGALLKIDTAGNSVSLDLQTDGGESGQSFSLSTNAQFEIAVAFNPPIVAHLMRWLPNSQLRYWSTEWIFDPYPELAAIFSPIMTLGNVGAKFFQGVRLTADTQNALVAFQIVFDGGQLGPLLPATRFNGKTTIPFSFVTPFIAHDIQIIPQGAARIFVPETEWVWEPVPELASNWITQATDHDFPGFSFLRDGWIGYQSAPTATAAEVLSITTEYGVSTYNLPPSATYVRPYQVLAPQKSRWKQYSVTSAKGVRLFVKDTNLRIKPWGSPGPFVGAAPFGDFSRIIGARI